MSGAEVGEPQLLQDGCTELGIALGSGQQADLLRYLDLMYVWNRSAGLTTIPREKAVRLHLLDSLAVLADVDVGPCLDLGTGAGLPGLVLAIARSDIEFVLAESNRKRCSFLLEVIRVLKVPNVRVIQGDVHALPCPPSYPIVVSRAFRPPDEFLAIARRLVAPAGRVILLLADPADGYLSELSTGIGMQVRSCRRFVLPGGVEPRCVVAFGSEERGRFT